MRLNFVNEFRDGIVFGSKALFVPVFEHPRLITEVFVYDDTVGAFSTIKLSQPRRTVTFSSIPPLVAIAGGEYDVNREAKFSTTIDVIDMNSNEVTSVNFNRGRREVATVGSNGLFFFAGGLTQIKGSDSFNKSFALNIYDVASKQLSGVALARGRAFVTAAAVDHFAVFAGGAVTDEAGKTVLVADIEIYDTTAKALVPSFTEGPAPNKADL